MTDTQTPIPFLARRVLESSLASLTLEPSAPSGAEVIDLSQSALPRSAGASITAAAAAALRAGATHYTEIHGLPDLRRALAEHLARDGLSYDPETEIGTCAGAQEGLFVTVMSLVRPGDQVLLPDPCREDLPALIRLAGGHPVRYASGGPPDFAFSAEAVVEHLTADTRLLILASPNDPTGTVPVDAIDKLADALERTACVVLADETHWAFIWEERTRLSAAGHPRLRARTVLVRSLGDAYGLAAWRIGYVAGPGKLLSPVLKARQALSISTSAAAQYAALAGLRLPVDSTESLAWLRQVKIDLGWLAGELSRRGYSVNRPAGGPWLLISDGRPELASRLAARGVLVADGARFGSLSRRWVRVTWTPRPVLSRALPQFAAVAAA